MVEVLRVRDRRGFNVPEAVDRRCELR